MDAQTKQLIENLTKVIEALRIEKQVLEATITDFLRTNINLKSALLLLENKVKDAEGKKEPVNQAAPVQQETQLKKKRK